MNTSINTTPRRTKAAISTVFAACMVLSACDTASSFQGIDAERSLSMGENAASIEEGVLFKDNVHQSVGEAVLQVEPATGDLWVTHISNSGLDGFQAEVRDVQGIRRTFEPIDLGGPGAQITWSFSPSFSDELTNLKRGWRLHNQGGILTLETSLNGPGSVLVSQVFDGGEPVDTLLAVSTNPGLEIRNLNQGIELVEVSYSLERAIRSYRFANNVLMQWAGRSLEGDEIRIVVLRQARENAVANSSSSSMLRMEVVSTELAAEVWHFLPGSGIDWMDVVAPGSEPSVWHFLPGSGIDWMDVVAPGSEPSVWHFLPGSGTIWMDLVG